MSPQAPAGDLPDDVRAALAERMGVNARLLDGFAVSEGRVLFEGQPIEGRYMNNAD